ncbi:hypothetical protein Aph01nite_33030 [Acrocarpospora phusangensis]|uniref:Secreted protein n=1 Tax=Acrocarpospora phusangensis TaxID=1070424 RepID=A0A919UP47_9ACTN|nr:hypothetical protein [Acrocarpospora phusangensis]GIH24993.1 hypothetical protein Aph01nite_33030 [Acrocarpospora phusangensis]
MFSPRALLAAAATATALALLVPAPAQAATCDPALIAPEGSLIGGLWRSNGGETSVYGCPVTREYNYASVKGSYQRFANGKIVWSPNLGGGALLRVFPKGRNVVFKWSGLGRDWDFFNVRWVVDAHLGNGTQQVKVARTTPWSGSFVLPKNAPREYDNTSSHGRTTDVWRFQVQGCDRGTFSSDCGPWSITTSFEV